MANTKSAVKRIRRISRQTVVNKARKSKFKNAIKKMNALLEAKKKKEALSFLPKLNSELMKVAKSGIIKKKMRQEIFQELQKKLIQSKILNFNQLQVV
jgi:small subunit ribosomal protein S20